MGSLLIIFATIFVLAPIAKAYADRISRQAPLDSLEVRNELVRLRDEVERLNGQMARLEDEHSFMVKLLGDGTRGKLGEGGKDAG
jgi:hypothetical protein